MKRIVRQELLNRWIEDNGPYGHEQLSVTARVSYPTIGEVRRGHVPARDSIRRRLAEAIGVTQDDLFPVMPEGKDKAS